MSEQVDDFLAHNGVKGMKWGKRKSRTETKDSGSEEQAPRKTYPRLTKKQAVIGASILVGVAIAAVVIANRGDIKATFNGVPDGYETAGKERVKNLLRLNGDRKDITLPQGQVFSRISTVAETNIRESTYVAYKPKDVLKYKAFYGSGKHQVKIESVGEVKLPSRKNKISTLSDMVDSPLTSQRYNGKSLREVLVDRERSPKGKAYFNTISTKKLAALVNDRMDVDDFRSGYGKEFLSKLKDKGYSAIADPIDSTSRGQGRSSASILIDTALFKVVESKKLSTEDVIQAKRDLDALLQK